MRETFHKNKYVSGLFVPDITAEELYTAAKLSIEAGADGVNFFNARSLLKDGKLQVVSRINQEYPLAELNKRIFKSANRFVVNVVYILKDCKCTYFP